MFQCFVLKVHRSKIDLGEIEPGSNFKLFCNKLNLTVFERFPAEMGAARMLIGSYMTLHKSSKGPALALITGSSPHAKFSLPTCVGPA